MQTYTVIVHEAEPDEGGYWAEVEELPGCFGSGESLDQLETDIKQAIESYMLALQAKGEAVPRGRETNQTDTRRWEIAVV